MLIVKLTAISLFWLPVKPRRVVDAAEYIRAGLQDDGYYKAEAIPKPVYVSLSQEAFNRASMQRTDGCVKYGNYLSQLDYLVNKVEQALDQGSCNDSRINAILQFNRLI